MKRLLSLLLLGLMLGLVVSSALASAEDVPEQTPTVQQIPTCPCCSGNITLPRDFKIQELKGATAYFVTMHLISSEDISNMKTRLGIMGILPEYKGAYVRFIRMDNKIIEQISVPLRVYMENGEFRGLLLVLRNSTGIYKVLAVETGTQEIHGVYVKETLDGKIRVVGSLTILLGQENIEKYGSIIAQSKIVVPIDKFMKVCKWTVNKICQKGLGGFWTCGFCVFAPLWPVGPAICAIICWYFEDKYSETIDKVCKESAETICRRLANLGLVIIE